MKLSIQRNCDQNVEIITVDDADLKQTLQKLVEGHTSILEQLHHLRRKVVELLPTQQETTELTKELKESRDALQEAIDNQPQEQTQQQ